MMMRSWGRIPLCPDRTGNQALIAACDRLESVRTFGGFLVDTMGFGKTFTSLLFLSYQALCSAQKLLPGQTAYKPTLCVVPSGLVLFQWIEAIERFPDLVLIVGHGERPQSSNSRRWWISATAMREAPANLKHWPKHLQYVFNQSDPRAASVVVLSSYETFASRTIVVHREQFKSGRIKKNYESKWKDIIGTVLMDEGHRLRHTYTKYHHSIRCLSANVHWFLTAMPAINLATVSYSYRYGEKRTNHR